LFDLPLIVFGAALVIASCCSLGRFVFPALELPQTIRFGLGAAVLSHVILLLVLTGTLYSRPLTALLILLALPLLRLRPGRRWDTPDRYTLIAFGPVVIIYGVFYAVNALAPEIQPDAASYHLGLVREWHIHNGFPDRIGFYEALPQGLEMLFAAAFDIGGPSAAKLVHFAFLIGTVPLLFATGKLLGMERWQASVAAVLYCCSPVVGISGTCAYNDAALVFFTLGAFYLLLRWDSDRRWQLLAGAGLLAGFCYSIKLTGLLVPALVFAYVLFRRRPRAALLMAATASLMIAPWMIRNLVWTGNPLAPLFNTLFENPHFHIASEHFLSETLRSYSGIRWYEIPLELTLFGWKLQGLIGPVFLLAPLALLSLRHRTGWILVTVAALLCAPWILNHGARFVMPALVFVALAMAVALPRKPATALAIVHALLALPFAMDLYASPNAWRLEELPLAAALRIEPEADYLPRAMWTYELAEMVSEHVPPTAQVFELFNAPSAYCDPSFIGPWHSAASDRMREALSIGAMTGSGIYSEFDARWETRELTAVRIRLAESNSAEWSIHEVRFRGAAADDRTNWTISTWPNIWEAGLAADGNLITKWAAWEPPRPNMYLQVNFGAPAQLGGVTVISPTAENQREIEFLGRLPDGKWVRLADRPNVLLHPAVNLHRSALGVLRANGVDYLLAPVSGSPFAGIGGSLVNEPGRWGVEIMDRRRDVYLVRIL
jgi:dolichyl-phosphate-mannose-protein mannosyltransferase